MSKKSLEFLGCRLELVDDRLFVNRAGRRQGGRDCRVGLGGVLQLEVARGGEQSRRYRESVAPASSKGIGHVSHRGSPRGVLRRAAVELLRARLGPEGELVHPQR